MVEFGMSLGRLRNLCWFHHWLRSAVTILLVRTQTQAQRNTQQAEVRVNPEHLLRVTTKTRQPDKSTQKNMRPKQRYRPNEKPK
jgi:hypothetical protein